MCAASAALLPPRRTLPVWMTWLALVTASIADARSPNTHTRIQRSAHRGAHPRERRHVTGLPSVPSRALTLVLSATMKMEPSAPAENMKHPSPDMASPVTPMLWKWWECMMSCAPDSGQPISATVPSAKPPNTTTSSPHCVIHTRFTLYGSFDSTMACGSAGLGHPTTTNTSSDTARRNGLGAASSCSSACASRRPPSTNEPAPAPAPPAPLDWLPVPLPRRFTRAPPPPPGRGLPVDAPAAVPVLGASSIGVGRRLRVTIRWYAPTMRLLGPLTRLVYRAPFTMGASPVRAPFDRLSTFHMYTAPSAAQETSDTSCSVHVMLMMWPTCPNSVPTNASLPPYVEYTWMCFRHATAYRPPPLEKRPNWAPFTLISTAGFSSSDSRCIIATRPLVTVRSRYPDGWSDTLCGAPSNVRELDTKMGLRGVLHTHTHARVHGVTYTTTFLVS